MRSESLPYRLIATDLDGTLLGGDHVTVSERTREALAHATAQGAAHIIVTGRPVMLCKDVLDSLDYRGLAVCGQGAQVYDAGEHRLLTSVDLDRQRVGIALAKIEAEVGPLFLAAERSGLDGATVYAPGYMDGFDLGLGRLESEEELWRTPLSRVYIQHPTLADDVLVEAARRCGAGLVDVVLAGAGIVELLPPGLTKATGLAVAAELLGMRAQETIAFGDMPNDIPMFRWAGHSVAMSAAHDDLKAVADEVTAGNDEDGIALVLERLYGRTPVSR
ncbi:HAD family hydrolase [Streptomyces sp. NPDC051183]|uniref:HAD family hydrolase n=1 Tax=unclassified Streptomyces TaxID=2593676 RepID=UPI00343B04BD